MTLAELRSWDRRAAQFALTLSPAELARVDAVMAAYWRQVAAWTPSDGVRPDAVRYENALEGFRAELACALALGLRWNGEDGDLGAPDVGRSIDVKSSKHPGAELWIPRLPTVQDRPVERRYVLVTGEAGRYVCRGWLPGSEILRPERLRDHTTDPRMRKGGAAWVATQAELYPFASLQIAVAEARARS